MSWYEELELLEHMIKHYDGANFTLHLSEACGWYTAIEIFGEPKHYWVSKCYPNKADVIGPTLDHMKQITGAPA